VPQQRARWFLIGRMGADGLAVWNHLYPDGKRVERTSGANGRGKGVHFAGSCSDCLRGGVYARVSARKPALIAAGNAVTESVAEWIGRKILAPDSAGWRE
jgi:site-specific DNA-cytosine methylase